MLLQYNFVMSSDLFDIGYRATQYDVIEGYENPSSINANFPALQATPTTA